MKDYKAENASTDDRQENSSGKGFWKKFSIIALTILAFIILIYVLDIIGKLIAEPSLKIYSKIKSNIVVMQIKSNLTDAEKEQVDWDYLKDDIYLIESGIGISYDRKIQDESDSGQTEYTTRDPLGIDFTGKYNKYICGQGYTITSPYVGGSSNTTTISVLDKYTYSKTTYFARVIPTSILWILMIPIFISLIKMSVIYFIRSKKDKFVTIRLIIFCIIYVVMQVITINWYK